MFQLAVFQCSVTSADVSVRCFSAALQGLMLQLAVFHCSVTSADVSVRCVSVQRYKG